MQRAWQACDEAAINLGGQSWLGYRDFKLIRSSLHQTLRALRAEGMFLALGEKDSARVTTLYAFEMDVQTRLSEAQETARVEVIGILESRLGKSGPGWSHNDHFQLAHRAIDRLIRNDDPFWSFADIQVRGEPPRRTSLHEVIPDPTRQLGGTARACREIESLPAALELELRETGKCFGRSAWGVDAGHGALPRKGRLRSLIARSRRIVRRSDRQ